MKHLYRFAFVTLLALLASQVAAAEKPRYRVVAKSSDTVYFMDVSSVKVRKGYLSAWFLLEEITPYRGGLSSKHLIAAKCQDDEHGFISFTRYAERGGRGEITESRDVKPSFVTAPPGSAAASFIGAMCGVKAGKPLSKIEEVWSADDSMAVAEELYGDLTSSDAAFVVPLIK